MPSEPLLVWTLPFSVADRLAIEALPAETRALIERYARSGEWAPVDAVYVEGWRAGVRAANQELAVRTISFALDPIEPAGYPRVEAPR